MVTHYKLSLALLPSSSFLENVLVKNNNKEKEKKKRRTLENGKRKEISAWGHVFSHGIKKTEV